MNIHNRLDAMEGMSRETGNPVLYMDTYKEAYANRGELKEQGVRAVVQKCTRPQGGEGYRVAIQKGRGKVYLRENGNQE